MRRRRINSAPKPSLMKTILAEEARLGLVPAHNTASGVRVRQVGKDFQEGIARFSVELIEGGEVKHRRYIDVTDLDLMTSGIEGIQQRFLELLKPTPTRHQKLKRKIDLS